ncbi:hypothetical protein V8E53_005206, partial [Lactarius tabidus]
LPTVLFKDIIKDIGVLMPQYGTLSDHRMEEARLCFLAPIFNRLIEKFGGCFCNTPETLMTGHIASKGWIEYQFKTFGSLTVVFVEVKLNVKECKDAIAQVIAECNVCDKSNNQIRVPVYGILCDGAGFQFFRFNGRTEANGPFKFAVGVFPSSRHENGQMLPIIDPLLGPTSLPFICSLCPICETIFNILMITYIATMKACREISVSEPNQCELRGPGVPGTLASWDNAIDLAK